MKRGNRTVWRVNEGQDIYDLISHHGVKDYFRYYRRLALNLKLWASTNILKLNAVNDLNKLDDFKKNWYSYIVNDFMPKVSLWACRMDLNFEFATLLESKIQKIITKYFCIGSHISKPDMSWLGKIEHKENIKIKFLLNNYPNVDDTTENLLKKLNTNTKVASVWKKKAIKRVTNENYEFAYTPWIPKEDAILGFLTTKGVAAEEISKLLHRSPYAIFKRAEYLKKIGFLEDFK